MTVINPSSISGITSITMPSGDGNVLTIHTNDGTERFRIDSSGNVKVGSACTISQDGDVFFTGVTTATTFTGAHSGSGANLTSLPAAQLTGALPAISGANLTGIAATDNVRTGILDVAGIATFRNDVNIGAGVTISESGIEASGIGITCANINGGAISGRRNLSINGACEVAQRGTSSTTYGYGSVDRFAVYYYGHNEAPTHSQSDVASGTTPYSLGFRKALKVTNGNQTSGAGAAQFMQIQHKYEAQDIAKSGWNYTSSSSFITVQFWVKASVAQTYYAYLRSYDGTGQRYYFSYALSADTWTKVVKTIPGNSNLQFDNNANQGFHINWGIWYGTDYTASGLSAETWAAYASGTRVPDMTSTWWTTNDATFEVTGVQMEVGPQATAFEHHRFAEELTLCERYCQMVVDGSEQSNQYFCTTFNYTSSTSYGTFTYRTTMRDTPSMVQESGSNYYYFYGTGSGSGFNEFSGLSHPGPKSTGIYKESLSLTQGHAGGFTSQNSSAKLYLDAEI